MKNQKQGLIFCHQSKQKSIFESSIYTLTSNLEVKYAFINKHIIKTITPNSKKILRKIAKSKFIYTQQSIELKPTTYYNSNYKKIELRRKVSQFNYFDIKLKNYSMFIPQYTYGVVNILEDYSLFTLSNLSLFSSLSILKKPTFKDVFISIESFEKINEAITTVRSQIFKDFSSFVSKFFKNVQQTITPIFSRRDLKNEIQVIGAKTEARSQIVININHEKLAVTNFIRNLGLESFSSNYLNTHHMVEAIRLYEVGEHKQFKDYTLNCVNQALKAIERKLISFDELDRYQALKEMNSLDSLKFMVELITDDELMEMPIFDEQQILRLDSRVQI